MMCPIDSLIDTETEYFPWSFCIYTDSYRTSSFFPPVPIQMVEDFSLCSVNAKRKTYTTFADIEIKFWNSKGSLEKTQLLT